MSIFTVDFVLYSNSPLRVKLHKLNNMEQNLET